jgi:phosphoglycolate phosphatase
LNNYKKSETKLTVGDLMNSLKNAIIFDLDGVLLDSESNMQWMEQALIDTLEAFDIKPTQQNLSMLDQKNLSRFPKAADYFNVNVKALWKKRNNCYTNRKVEAIKTKQIHPFPDTKAVHKIKNIAKLGILSNSPQEVVDEFLIQFDFQKVFTAGVGRSSKYEDIFRLKPHPLLWNKLKPKLHATSLFYVGDRKTDKIFAEKMNMKFFGLNRYHQAFTNGYSSLQEIVDEILKIIKT